MSIVVLAIAVFGVAILIALGFINDTLRRIETLLSESPREER